MKIEKAIEELEGYNSATFETNFITFSEARQLGIEALKRIDLARRSRDVRIIDHLPRETKE